jgi:hypothetical protein
MAWYLAELVLEHVIEDEPRNVVHLNMHLVRARNLSQAEKKARIIGDESAISYKNTDGKTVDIRFRGIRNVYELLDGVKDGAEILWEERISVPEEKILKWVTPAVPKRSHRRGNTLPNYMPEDVMQDLEAAGFDRDELQKM